MKIRYLIMFKMLLALFGCSKAPKTTTVSTEAGPFTIETITQTGKLTSCTQLNAKSLQHE